MDSCDQNKVKIWPMCTGDNRKTTLSGQKPEAEMPAAIIYHFTVLEERFHTCFS